MKKLFSIICMLTMLFSFISPSFAYAAETKDDLIISKTINEYERIKQLQSKDDAEFKK